MGQELITISAILLTCIAYSESWSYDTEIEWPIRYPKCNGENQSPVDIQHKDVWFDRKLTAFETPGYESIPRNAHWELRNTGHSLQVLLNGDYILSDGGLDGSYKAAYMEFHWGKSNDKGSEHTFDGEFYGMECHVVHYSTKCGSFDEALHSPAGIAILAFVFKAHKVDNPTYKHILNYLPNVSHSGESISLRPLPLLSFLPVNLNDYYRYEGSLTFPPCSESVIWTIFTNKIYISHQQLSYIRDTLLSSQSDDPEHKSLIQNRRQLQPLNDRTIYSSNPDDATIFSHPFSSPMSITMAVFFGMLVLILFTKADT